MCLLLPITIIIRSLKDPILFIFEYQQIHYGDNIILASTSRTPYFDGQQSGVEKTSVLTRLVDIAF